MFSYNLQFDGLSVQFDRSNFLKIEFLIESYKLQQIRAIAYEIYSYGANVAFGIGIIRKSK